MTRYRPPNALNFSESFSGEVREKLFVFSVFPDSDIGKNDDGMIEARGYSLFFHLSLHRAMVILTFI